MQMARSRAQPIKCEYFWRLANQGSVILPSLERKLRKNALSLNQSTISNFARYAIKGKSMDVYGIIRMVALFFARAPLSERLEQARMVTRDEQKLPKETRETYQNGAGNTTLNL